jgi:probable HAF family extracellular repeat protein
LSLAASCTVAESINDKGQVVGYYVGSNSHVHGFESAEASARSKKINFTAGFLHNSQAPHYSNK